MAVGAGASSAARASGGASSARGNAYSAAAQRGAATATAGFGGHHQRPSTTQPSAAARARLAVPSLAIGRLKQTASPLRVEGQRPSSRWVPTSKPHQQGATTSRNQNTALSTNPSRLTSGRGLSTARTIPVLRMTSKPKNTIYKYKAMPSDTGSLLGRGVTRNFQIGVKMD